LSTPHDSSELKLDGFPVRSDADGLQSRDALEVLLSRFADEVREGKMPSIDSYALRYPECAAQIRELFPLVQSLEQWKGDKEVECLRRTVPDTFSVQKLGQYEILRELGRGGMGVVFESVHPTTHRPVAIKLLPWRYAADMPRWKERFHREAATIAALRHRNIVPVYSFGEHDGYYYYAMQCIDGVGLDKVIARMKSNSRPCSVAHLLATEQSERTRSETASPVKASAKSVRSTAPMEDELVLTRDSWRAFARLTEQVAGALAHAHEQGVLHNDIKPSNLLVRPNGQVIVTDFGIGRLNDSEAADVEESPIGTLKYMAPERLTGVCDARGDVYSLGLTLYELITQTAPFDALNRTELLYRVLNTEPRPPRQIVPQIPVPLETIVLKAVDKDAAGRYATAEEFADDLRRFINGRPIRATRKGLLQRALAWYRKSRRIAD
jgi:eukaryotic-like serine/threonine-protein kinase